MKDKSFVFVLAQIFILWTKRTRRSEIVRLLSDWMKIHQIGYLIFETASQFSFELCITLQCHER